MAGKNGDIEMLSNARNVGSKFLIGKEDRFSGVIGFRMILTRGQRMDVYGFRPHKAMQKSWVNRVRGDHVPQSGILFE